jgi:hypothetical protein
MVTRDDGKATGVVQFDLVGTLCLQVVAEDAGGGFLDRDGAGERTQCIAQLEEEAAATLGGSCGTLGFLRTGGVL